MVDSFRKIEVRYFWRVRCSSLEVRNGQSSVFPDFELGNTYVHLRPNIGSKFGLFVGVRQGLEFDPCQNIEVQSSVLLNSTSSMFEKFGTGPSSFEYYSSASDHYTLKST